MADALNVEEVRRRLTDPGMSQRLASLRFREADAAEALESIVTVIAGDGLLDVVTHYADRLVGLIGDFRQHPEVWDDIPAPHGLPSGTLPLLALLASADDVANWHRERGIDEDASDSALADLGQQVRVHRLSYGVFGLHNHGWVTWAWSGALYWLGRLQFNLQQSEILGEDSPRWVLSTHIPRGGRLDPDSIDGAFARARAFFARHFAEYAIEYFYCDSWLLDPALPERLPGTNLAAFQRRWTRFGAARSGEEDVLFFVFDRRPDSPTAGKPLPSETSLQRVAAAKLGSAEPWISAKGMIPLHPHQQTRQIMGTLLPGFVGTTLPDRLAALLRQGLAGVCLFGQNIESPEQTRRLTDAVYAANPHAIVAIDEEGGDVTRLFARTGSPYPGNAVLGRLDDLSVTRASAAEVSGALRSVGCNVTFAPSVDVNSNPDNPVIGVRSFGTDSARVAVHGAAWIDGLQSTGVAATAKHFPGHGDTDTDSHVALPRVDRNLAALEQRELVPFASAVRAGVKLVMTSHIVLPQLDSERPGTMSPTVLELLRHNLGFDGVIVTDALDMAGAQASLDPHGPQGLPGAALAALAAGCDLLCLGTENTEEEITDIVKTLTRAIDQDQLSPRRLREAANRVAQLADGMSVDQGHPQPREPSVALDEELIVTAFDLRPGTTLPNLRDATVLQLESDASLAIGRTPWAPALTEAAGHLVLDLSSLDFHSQDLRESELAQSPGRPIIVLGRSLHLDAAATAIIDSLRDTHDEVVVVDMGWPAEDRRYADLATFGASAIVGEALARYLGATV